MMRPVCHACGGSTNNFTSEKCAVCGGTGVQPYLACKPCGQCRCKTTEQFDEICMKCTHYYPDQFEAKT